jgi:hypothetical protein
VHTAAGVNATGRKSHYYSFNKRAEDFGYRPALTSLDGIFKEINKVVDRTPDESQSC